MPGNCVIALKLCDGLPDIEAEYIGADAGALWLAKKGIGMKLAVGDFDSVAEEDMALIRPLRHAIRMGYDRVWLACRMGGRMDHTWVNFRLALMFPEQAVLYDRQNRIMAYGTGRHVIHKDGYAYFSVFTDQEAVISLAGMKYPLQETRISHRDVFTVSNEIEGEEGILEVHEGLVLVMQCRDA